VHKLNKIYALFLCIKNGRAQKRATIVQEKPFCDSGSLAELGTAIANTRVDKPLFAKTAKTND